MRDSLTDEVKYFKHFHIKLRVKEVNDLFTSINSSALILWIKIVPLQSL